MTLATRTAASATLTIDLDAVAANVRTIRRLTPAEIMAVVKADGFGHGMADVARAALAGGATRFGTTSIAEALVLRAAGLRHPILSWLNPVDADFGQAVDHDIEVAIPSLDHLHAVAGLRAGLRVHLQLDTGMARDGAPPELWRELCEAARRAEAAGAVRVVGVMGHLACAAVPGHPANALGRERFAWALRVARAARLRPGHRHLAATAATLSDRAAHYTMCRIGAGLVGIDESGSIPLRRALRLTAPLVAVRDVPEGTPVGYGHTWVAPRATRLGLIPVGYADGLPHAASGRAQVQIAGVRRPVVGRICMDMAVIDLGSMAVKVGDLVTVFGPGDDHEPTTADWARWAHTVEHEIVTGLGRRLHRNVASRRTA